MLGVEAQVGIRMKDFGEWKPLLNKTSHVLPRHPALLTATLYHSQPTFAHLKSKALEAGEISRNGMEVEVASNHALQPLPDFRQRLMHAPPKFVLHLFQLSKESLSDTLAQHEELAVLPQALAQTEWPTCAQRIGVLAATGAARREQATT